MKTITFKLFLFFFALPGITFSNGDENSSHTGKYKKEKKYSKAYNVNSNAALKVTNQFGSIYVTTWDEDQTTIDVVVKVSADKEEIVNKRINSIDVKFDATKSFVSALTEIGNFSGKNVSFEINYTIKIPKKGTIDLNNQFGNTIVGKVYGKSNLNCQYGDLSADELNSEFNIINLQYSGTSKINYMKAGDINAQYSGFNATKIGSLKLKAQYSASNIGEVNSITYKTEYGDLTIKKGGTISGSGDYSAQRFGYVTNLVNATCNYGEVKIGGMGTDVKNVAINASYSAVNIGYNENAGFDFEFKLEYGSLRGASGFKFTQKSEKDNKSYYKGYYKSSGNSKIYVKLDYGDINLNRG